MWVRDGCRPRPGWAGSDPPRRGTDIRASTVTAPAWTHRRDSSQPAWKINRKILAYRSYDFYELPIDLQQKVENKTSWSHDAFWLVVRTRLHHSQAIQLWSMRTVLQVSQRWRYIDADPWCKRTVTFLCQTIQYTFMLLSDVMTLNFVEGLHCTSICSTGISGTSFVKNFLLAQQYIVCNYMRHKVVGFFSLCVSILQK